MTTEQTDATAANVEAAHREAVEYWGYLIKPDKCGTETFDRLLNGIANTISQKFEPHDSADLTPSQLAAFYRAVGGNYDVLFIETPPSSISFIYRSLGAFHSLQPTPDDDGYSAPSVPALKHKGFVTWQTIQLLLGPEEHVPFLQKAVELFDVKDPKTGAVFPKVLPKECFPERPDDAMEEWYEGVAERLKKEAETDAAEKTGSSRVRVEVDDPGPRASTEISSDDERHGAATYFSDPLFRKARTRPQFMRHFSKQPTYVENQGRLAVNRVRHMLNPFHKDRRRSLREDDDFSDNAPTPVASVAPVHVYTAPQAHRYPPANHKRPHPPRRDDSLSTTDSESDSDAPPSRHRTPILKQGRSHDPPISPREYFPPYREERRYSRDVTPERPARKEDGPPSLYGPTQTPIFATHVAQLQAHNYVPAPYDRRPAMPARTSYRPNDAPKVRYALDPEVADPPYVRERGRDGYDSTSSRHRERARRKSEEHPRDRDRNRDRERGRDRYEGVRTRSHDRLKDDWDDRDRSRDVDRERERDRDRGDGRVRARYVSGVEGGVGGRRYPVGYER